VVDFATLDEDAWSDDYDDDDIDRRGGGSDEKYSSPSSSAPRGGVSPHILPASVLLHPAVLSPYIFCRYQSLYKD
jgi:hypothetical protein